VLPAFVVLGIVATVTTRAAARGELARNGMMGIRTRATRSSDAAWEAGHQAASRPMYWCAVACAVSLVVVLGVAVAGGSDGGVLLTAGVGGAVVMALLLFAVRQANGAARAAGGGGPLVR
jgi:hypothetical protein